MKKEIYICDRCGAEIKGEDFYNLNLEWSDGTGVRTYQICPNCFNKFKFFIDIQADNNLLFQEALQDGKKPNNHGIERMTIGAK